MKDCYSWVDRNGQKRYNLPEENRMDYETFIQTKMHKCLTPQSCEDMIKFMQTHSDLYVATDMKRNDVVEGYRYLACLAKAMNAEEVLDLIVVSLYDYSDYEDASRIYPFQNYAMRQYINSPQNYYELANFCIRHRIHAVNILKCYANDEGVRELVKKGIHIYWAVVDDPEEFDEYRKLGITGCVSNWLHQVDLN